MKFFRKLGKNLLLSLASIIATLLLLELVLWAYVKYRPEKASELFLEPERATFVLNLLASDGQTPITPPRERYSGMYNYTVHPYLVYKLLPDQHYEECNINSMGLRGKEVSKEKSPGTFRIIVTGGSAAFAMHSSNDSTAWPAKLEQKLNACEAFPGKVEIINAGIIGYHIMQEILFLRMELLEFSPDLVLAFTGYNDYSDAVEVSKGCTTAIIPSRLSSTNLFYDLSYQVEEHGLEQERPILSGINDLLAATALSTYTGKFFYKRIKALKDPSAVPIAFLQERPAQVFADRAEPSNRKVNPDCVAAITDNYRNNVQKMARMLNPRNIALVNVLQPILGLKKELSEEEKAVLDDYRKAGWYDKAVAQIYTQMAKAVEAVAAENPKMRFVDVTGTFGDWPGQAFYDDCHLTDQGNEMVAQFLADYLCRHGKDLQPR